MNAMTKAGASLNETIPLRQIARSFGQAAASYDAHAALQRRVADALLHRRDAGPPTAILDLGCGTGYCAARMRESGVDADLVALDLALPMLQATRARQLPKLALVCADAMHLPLADRSFDLVVSSLTIQWCFDYPALFAELHRVLRPGGQALLSTFGPATLREVREAWAAVDEAVHVNTFAPLHDVHAAALTAGFSGALCTELQVSHYPSLRALAQELKGIGAHNMNAGRSQGLMSRQRLRQADAAFTRAAVAGLGAPASWELGYLDLRKSA